MPYKPIDEKTVGLALEGGMLKAAFVVAEKGQFTISRLLETPVPLLNDDPEKPPQVYPEAIELKSLADRYLTISALPASDVLVRRMRLKLTKEKDIDEAFAFQAEPLLPYPIDQAVLDKFTIEKQDGTTLLGFLAAKKESVSKHLAQYEAFQIDPEVVSTETIALAYFSAVFSNPAEMQFVVHIGRKSSLCALLRMGKLAASHVVAAGWEELLESFKQDRAPTELKAADLFAIDLSAIDPFLKKHLNVACAALLQKIQWTYMAATKELKPSEAPSLVVVGEGANLLGMPEKLAAALALPLSPVKESYSKTPETEVKSFAIPIGLALSAQPKLGPTINFRRDELAFASPWKRFKKPISLYIALCAVLAAALYFFGISYLTYREDGLKDRYLSLLSLAQKPYDKFESQYETKYPSPQYSENPLSINELNAGELQQRLEFLEKEIRAMPDTFPLFPNTPRVSDLLAWLSVHPVLTCGENDKEGEECPTFTIETLNYTLVKRPELNKKNEKYQVKVDMEFSTSSPRLAREFHDALITPNDLIDPKGEVKWNATKGKYRTSFFLKDKTFYPGPLSLNISSTIHGSGNHV